MMVLPLLGHYLFSSISDFHHTSALTLHIAHAQAVGRFKPAGGLFINLPQGPS